MAEKNENKIEMSDKWHPRTNDHVTIRAVYLRCLEALDWVVCNVTGSFFLYFGLLGTESVTQEFGIGRIGSIS